jgi:cellulose synthase/poly-beta-1,6-N-acetylglucosamine synthase-like glycosyltransferase
MIELGVFIVSAVTVAWVYAGYPLALAVLARLRPRPRRREAIELKVSVIVPAHEEAETIGVKLASVLNSDYPRRAIETIVVSDGSTDGTAALADRAGADRVLDLPRVGKSAALVAGAQAATGEVLAFTDADALFAPDTLRELVANFADPNVGGVAANQVFDVGSGRPVEQGQGLYWRYDQWIKQLEDRVGNTVSAGGGLYAVRRKLFKAPPLEDGTDDFLISSHVVRAGFRLAYDEHARVLLRPEGEGRSELRRKIRVMNRGQRAAFSLGRLLIPFAGGMYGFQLLSHQVLRRIVPFFLLGALASSALLAVREPWWWLVLAPQLLVYTLAAVAVACRRRRWGSIRVLAVPYFFCLGNLAAGLAMLSLASGRRYESWKPGR